MNSSTRPAERETTTAYSDSEEMFYIHDVPPGRYVTAEPYAGAGTVPVQ